MSPILTDAANGIASIRFNRPEALNAFTPELLEALVAAIAAADDDPATRAIILSGEGRAFSAGVDLKVLKGIKPAAGRVGDVSSTASRSTRRRRSAARRSRSSPKCTAPASRARWSWLFIATLSTRPPAAKFGDTHAKWGLRPTWGMSQTLARAVGVRRARELSFTARTFTGAEAAAWGLVQGIAADKDELDTLTAATAAQVAAASPGAVAAYKKLYRIHEENQSLEDSLRAEVEAEFPEIVDTAERLAGFGV